MAHAEYDALIIGAGQGGVPLAVALAQAGWRTALVERSHVGGTCVNEGCTPTKTMVASARVAYLASRAADFGVHVGDVAVDMAQVRARKRRIVESFRGGSERHLAAAGVTVIRGEARFEGPAAMSVGRVDGELHLSAPHIFLDTGERPARPPIPGLETIPYLDSTTIMELDHLPEHLLVLGGGYVGLEFGQMFRRFGSRVTVVEKSARLLAREDDDVADAVADVLREDGIDVLLSAGVTRVGGTAGGVLLTIEQEGVSRQIAGTHLLVAVGRRPNTDSLALEVAGITTDARGYIVVNDRLETSASGVWALGDVKGPPAFTHISYDDYRILRTNLLEHGHASTAGRLVPYTVFIDPQLGRVGLTESQARQSGHEVRVYRMPMSRVARALETDEARGFLKAVVDSATGQILGAAVLGLEGGELASALELAMMGGLRYEALREGIFAHPGLAEAFNNLFSER